MLPGEEPAASAETTLNPRAHHQGLHPICEPTRDIAEDDRELPLPELLGIPKGIALFSSANRIY